MQMAVLFALSLVGTCAVWFFLSYYDLKKENNEKEPFSKQALKPSGKRLAYLICMMISLVGISFWLDKTYLTNSLVDNAKLLCLLMVLFASANVDMRKQIIPNMVILSGLIMRTILWIIKLITNFNGFWLSFKGEVLSCLIIGLFLLLCALLMKGGIGMGDVKLIMVMCLFQGFYGVISSLFFSLFAAFIIAIGLLISRKKRKKDVIPFAPSILVGTLISVFLTGM